MLNIENFGIANGILINDPVVLINKDKSKKILLTVRCTDMTRDKNGNRTFQNIPLQGFIPKSYDGIGPYKYLHAGDEVHAEYTIKANPYQGEHSIICQIDSIKFGKDMKATLPKTAEKNNKPSAPAPKAAPVNETPTTEDTSTDAAETIADDELDILFDM